MTPEPPPPTEPAEADAAPSTEQVSGESLPPRSKAVVIGLVIGIVFVLPWPEFAAFWAGGFALMGIGAKVGLLAAAVAVVLGLYGVAQAVRRRRRGLGIAITVILVGIVAVYVQFISARTMAKYTLQQARSTGFTAAAVLASKPNETADNAVRWLNELASERFRSNVSPEAMTQWLDDQALARGILKDIQPGKERPHRLGPVVTLPLTGVFQGGEFPINLSIVSERTSFKIDDIQVEDSSPQK